VDFCVLYFKNLRTFGFEILGGSLTSRDGRSDVTGTCENNFKCQFTRFLSEFRKTHLMMSRLSSVTGRWVVAKNDRLM